MREQLNPTFDNGKLELKLTYGTVALTLYSENALEAVFTPKNGPTPPPSRAIGSQPAAVSAKLVKTKDKWILQTDGLEVDIQPASLPSRLSIQGPASDFRGRPRGQRLPLPAGRRRKTVWRRFACAGPDGSARREAGALQQRLLCLRGNRAPHVLLHARRRLVEKIHARVRQHGARTHGSGFRRRRPPAVRCRRRPHGLSADRRRILAGPFRADRGPDRPPAPACRAGRWATSLRAWATTPRPRWKPSWTAIAATTSRWMPSCWICSGSAPASSAPWATWTGTAPSFPSP